MWKCVCGSDGTRIFMMIMIKYEELERGSNLRIASKLSEKRIVDPFAGSCW